ncbi:hypothetical protein [Microbacterium elymi]|uniref:Uncharacterized protein n=1 Tax=Microbacterium elymi TaxID=2909587 RepID=A0ABY5NJG0_9MICO|nr:hypothetical protein [Microbacterium elymi]UUT35216.1 hypothetical protein L2X98_33925 [Microbacterium elymi]
MRGLGVAHDVGQRLLDDAIRGRLDAAARQVPVEPVLEGHLEPVTGALGHEGRELGQLRLAG